MPGPITNYHTHTTFCDGQDTAEDTAFEALKKGVSILGFSSHSMFPFSTEWHIPGKDFNRYCDEIQRLKKLFSDKMTILLGFEVDYIPGISLPSMTSYSQFNPDYMIGSVHYVGTPDGTFAIDDATENVEKGIKSLFKGDGKKVVCEYFALQREMLKKGDFSIWGHPDVIRKRNGVLHFFDENESWYKNELKETAKVAAKSSVIAEINTGGIIRKAIDDVYPSAEFLSLLHELKIPVIFSSDAHTKENVISYFDRAEKAARNAGYNEVLYINSERQTVSLPL